MNFEISILSGANGTLRQQTGLSSDAIYKAYSDVGVDYIKTDTFEFSHDTLPEYLVHVKEEILKVKALNKIPVVSVGPSNVCLFQKGSFTDLQADYLEIFEAVQSAGGDLVLLETFQDIQNLKAALSAGFEVEGLKFIVCVSPQENGMLLDGTSLESAAVFATGYSSVIAFGINCCLVKEQMNNLKKLNSLNIPLAFIPNAGIPQDGKYQDAWDWGVSVSEAILHANVVWVGGCCGTTPQHIAELLVENSRWLGDSDITYVSGRGAVPLVKKFKIAEALNANGSKKFREAAISMDMDTIISIALQQMNKGADAIDINLDSVEIPYENKIKIMEELSSNPAVTVPFCLDSSSTELLEDYLKIAKGRCIVNSISLEDGVEQFRDQIEMCQKYGALPIVRAQHYKYGFGASYEEKFLIWKESKEVLVECGVRDYLYDVCFTPICLDEGSDVLMAGVQSLTVTLAKLGVKVCPGLSNISYAFKGLAEFRARLNSAVFKVMGCHAAICNPTHLEKEDASIYEAVLECNSNRLKELSREVYQSTKSKSEKPSLEECLMYGLVGDAVAQLNHPLDDLMEAVFKIGKWYDEDRIPLVSMLSAASTLKKVLAKLNLKKEREMQVLFCTGEGDIHDIGKDITKEVLGVYGVEAIDLGVDVSAEKLYNAIKETSITTVCISGLITPTLDAMSRMIQYLNDKGVVGKVILGGAVVTSEFCKTLNKKFGRITVAYAKTPIDTVKEALL